jgi:hypothetical protein
MTDRGLLDVWAGASDDFLIVGEGATVLRWNGVSFEGGELGMEETLLRVQGTGASDVYAVGGGGTILHWNGVAWSRVAAGTTSSLLGVWGSGPNDVFAVGAGGVILRRDGPAWSVAQVAGVENLPHVPELYGVWSSGPNDTVVVGDGAILRWDGASWFVEEEVDAVVHGVWGSGPNDIFAVGRYSGIGSPSGIWRWNGDQWTSMSISETHDLQAVWGSGPDDVYAVGRTFLGNAGVVVHWDGGEWQTLSADTARPSLYGIWGSGPTNIFASGVVFGVNSQGAFAHWNGLRWTNLYQHEWPAVLYGVWGSGAADILAVGYQGGVLAWDGAAWSTSLSIPTVHNLEAVWGSGPHDVFTVGSSGLIMHHDGFAWAPMDGRTTTTLAAVGGAHEVVAVGWEGTVLQRARSCVPAERHCPFDRDDDCDGLHGCADPDCLDDAYCAAGGACSDWLSVACGSTLTGTTAGGPSRMNRYACNEWLATGREAYFRFVPSASGQVTVELADMTRDLDLIVLREGAGGGCDPRRRGCVGASSTGGVASEAVTFTAEAGTPYYIVVDGYGTNAGAFALTVTCP